MVLKEYALTKVFSRDVADAHLKGDIHLHDLGMVNRPYCSGQSVAYPARYGLNIPSITSVSNPAKHADVLLAHMLKMTSVLQNHFAGAIGWDAVNMFFAPYTVGWSYEQYRQLAQQLIFELSSSSTSSREAAAGRSPSPTSTSTMKSRTTSATCPR